MRRMRLPGLMRSAANSLSNSPPPASGCPLQATKTVRPLDIKSRQHHWYARISASRSGVLAKQAGPSRTRLVRAARAPSSAIASSRGLAKIESPTQTEFQPAPSAHSDISSISGTVVAPITTPRLGSVSPNFGFVLMEGLRSAFIHGRRSAVSEVTLPWAQLEIATREFLLQGGSILILAFDDELLLVHAVEFGERVLAPQPA